VGEAGDRVVTGDWWCDGDPALALLRPGSGEVFVFGRWASAGADVEASPAGRFAGATALRAADLDGDGCGELVVERGDASPAVALVPDERPA
jgi:hypothetical protein